jgi:hypothetical protein
LRHGADLRDGIDARLRARCVGCCRSAVQRHDDVPRGRVHVPDRKHRNVPHRHPGRAALLGGVEVHHVRRFLGVPRRDVRARPDSVQLTCVVRSDRPCLA